MPSNAFRYCFFPRVLHYSLFSYWQNYRTSGSGTSFSRTDLKVFSLFEAVKHSWIISDSSIKTLSET